MSTSEWMTFYLANELYAVDILSVKEIRSPSSVTRIPRAQKEVMGAINLRGDIVPIVDLRVRLGLPTSEDTQDTVFIIVQFEQGSKFKTLGIKVDAVADVVQMQGDQLHQQSQQEANSCIAAIAEHSQGSIALLAVHRLLALTPDMAEVME
ncbi:chemotaxis protein CheW [Salinibius halmophilus]|uniref:chemotaxis protein CheW n=1 Tax=Salinibius halmophilus TaxID=1853216 RepID=UPI000E66947F|nr:chemotaxis protein CheW [Salinibius halmophilus]